MLGPGDNVQPPEARISRGLEVHPEGGGVDLDVWIDRSLIRRGYAWSVPADGEQRVGVGSYEPRDHVKEPTREIAARVGVPPVRYQGNWFPHQLRPAVEDGVFFVGDSAGHCFPLSGEGIRTAFYFGIACGRELRAVLAGERTREAALAAYGAFSRRHARAFAWALALQRAIPALPPRLLARLLSARRPAAAQRARLRLVPAPGRSGLRRRAHRIRRPMDAIAYDDRGLVPCVVQDWSTGEVLTLAYMNAEALERTRATGETTSGAARAASCGTRARRPATRRRSRSSATTATPTRSSRSSSPPAPPATPASAPASTTASSSPPPRTRRCPRSSARSRRARPTRRRAPTPPSCSPTPP